MKSIWFGNAVDLATSKFITSNRHCSNTEWFLRPQFRILNAFFFLIKSIYGWSNSKLLGKNPFDFTNFSMKKNFICCGTKLFTWFLFLRSHRWLLFFSSLTSLQSYNICIDVNEVRLNIFFSLFLLYTLCPSHSVIWQCSHVFDNWHIHWITNKQLSKRCIVFILARFSHLSRSLSMFLLFFLLPCPYHVWSWGSCFCTMFRQIHHIWFSLRGGAVYFEQSCHRFTKLYSILSCSLWQWKMNHFKLSMCNLFIWF